SSPKPSSMWPLKVASAGSAPCWTLLGPLPESPSPNCVPRTPRAPSRASTSTWPRSDHTAATGDPPRDGNGGSGTPKRGWGGLGGPRLIWGALGGSRRASGFFWGIPGDLGVPGDSKGVPEALVGVSEHPKVFWGGSQGNLRRVPRDIWVFKGGGPRVFWGFSRLPGWVLGLFGVSRWVFGVSRWVFAVFLQFPGGFLGFPGWTFEVFGDFQVGFGVSVWVF
ncbi:hypothetical protein DV515_00020018, partial [Chloebia gouldiae]